MAVYSYDKYGNFLYGAKDNTSPYYHSNIKAEAIAYNTVHITWNQVVPDPLDSNPTYWALVKTLTGLPDSPYEGKIVTGGAVTQPNNVGALVDTAASTSFNTEWYESFTTNTNVEVNYSLWVFNPDISSIQSTHGWINCGDSNTVIIAATTTLDTISNWIPRAWQNSINGVGETLGEYEYEDLINTLQAYSLTYDTLRIKTNLLELSNTPRYLTTALAKARQLDFGFEEQTALGDPYYRSLTYSGDKVNSLKGTIKGLSQYIVALTHMENKIEVGHNLFLDYNDSSFEESLGQWKVNKIHSTDATPLQTIATQITYSSTTGTAHPHLAPAYSISDTSADGGPITRTLGAMKVVIASGGAGVVLCPTSTLLNLDQISPIYPLSPVIVDNRTLIPVKAGASYVFNGWAIGDPTTYSTVTPYISWFDYSGKLIGSTINSATVTAAAVTGTGSAAILTYTSVNSFIIGQKVTITGLTTSTFNVTDAVITSVQGNQFTISAVGITGTSITGGANGIARGTIVNVPQTITSSWAEINAGSDMAAMVGTTMGIKAPINAAFALPLVKVTGAGTTYLDMFQFAEHQYSLEYQDARQLNIYLRGQEENILKNSSFETATSGTTTGWFANNAILDSVNFGYNDGYDSLSIFATANASLDTYLAPEEFYSGPIVYSDWMPVDPNISYTFTLYPTSQTQSNQFKDYKGRIGIEFSSMPSEEKQNAIVSYPDSNAYFYGSTNYLVTSEITSATYDDTNRLIYLVFKTGDPIGFRSATVNPSYVSIKGMLNYPELNISGLWLSKNLNGQYYVTLPTNLLYTPDGAVDTSNALMVLMYYDNGTNVYEDLVSYANITELYVDLSGDNVHGANTKPSYVTAIAPPYSKDTGMPYARVYLMPEMINGHTVLVDGVRFSPTLLVDQYYQQSGTSLGNVASGPPLPIGFASSQTGTSGDLVSSNKTKASEYFSGYGNSLAALNNGNINPLVTQYYDPRFCAWERKLWYNFIDNPNFAMSDMGWNSIGDAALLYDSVNMLENVSFLAGLTGGATTTFTLPHPAFGGEDIVVTFTITGMHDNETYSITSPDLSTPIYGNTPYIYNSSLTTYTSEPTQTLSAVFQAVTGSMMGTIELNVISNGVDDVNVNILSATADYGSTASAMFNDGDAGAFTLANPMDSTMTLHASFTDNKWLGISSYTPDWPIKVNRLIATIKDYIPNGSTFRITKGWPSKPITDLTESLIYSASFEKHLGYWTGTDASLARITYPGRYLDLVTHGIAYARVTANSLEPYQNYFGIISEPIYIDYTKSYYGSVAVRPVPGTNAQGFYSLKVDAYKKNTSILTDSKGAVINNGTDILLTTFNNRIEFNTLPTVPAGRAFTTGDHSTLPVHQVEGDRWVDPNSNAQVAEYTWVVNTLDGLGQWVENDESIYYNPGNEAAFTGYVTFAKAPPANPIIGDRWFDIGGNAYGEYIGYVWYDDQQSIDYDPDTGDPVTPAWTAQWVELSTMYTQNDVYLDEIHSPTWAYINVILNKNDLQQISYSVSEQSTPSEYDVDYVRIRVECVPDQTYPNQAFDVDRVVFRE